MWGWPLARAHAAVWQQPNENATHLFVGATVGFRVGLFVGTGEGGRVGAGVGKVPVTVIVPVP